MRILETIAPKFGPPLCLAVTALWAASLQAQTDLNEVTVAAPGSPVTVAGPDLERSVSRAGAQRNTSDPGISSRRAPLQLAERKLRDKFNAFDYTDELPPNLGFSEFEQSLESRFFGTYVFYSKLTGEQRLQVYESYRRDRHISAIRTSTLDLLH